MSPLKQSNNIFEFPIKNCNTIKIVLLKKKQKTTKILFGTPTTSKDMEPTYKVPVDFASAQLVTEPYHKMVISFA